MKKNIPLYPTLDATIIEKSSPTIDYKFQYKDDLGVFSEIEHYIEGRDITLNDKVSYTRDTDDLNITVTSEIKEVDPFFGPCGVLPKNGKLGLALECYSPKTRFRRVITSPDQISFGMQIPFKTAFHLTIPKRTVSSYVEIKIILFIAEKAADDRILIEENFLCNKEGVILGYLSEKKLFLSGTGALFPIENRPLQNNKLWDIEISYDDPSNDQLIDSVKLLLNTNSKDYSYINPSSKSYCEPFIYEIIAEAMTLLIIQLKENGDLSNTDEECQSGSILEEMRYLKNVIGIDFSDAKSISTTLREYLRGEQNGISNN